MLLRNAFVLVIYSAYDFFLSYIDLKVTPIEKPISILLGLLLLTFAPVVIVITWVSLKELTKKERVVVTILTTTLLSCFYFIFVLLAGGIAFRLWLGGTL